MLPPSLEDLFQDPSYEAEIIESVFPNSARSSASSEEALPVMEESLPMAPPTAVPGVTISAPPAWAGTAALTRRSSVASTTQMCKTPEADVPFAQSTSFRPPLYVSHSDAALPLASRSLVRPQPNVAAAAADSPLRRTLVGISPHRVQRLSGERDENGERKAAKPAVRKPLSSMLDEVVPPTPSDLLNPSPKKRVRQSAPNQGADEAGDGSDLTIDTLRATMRESDTFERIVDMFQRFDSDHSGLIDMREFTLAVMEIVEDCDPEDVENLFCEIDHDNSGQISYIELKDTFRAAAERAARATAVPPPLPSHLQPRARDVVSLYHDFKKNQLDQRAKTVCLPNFEECLRLYYPKDSRETHVKLAQWVEAMLEYKKGAMEEKTRQNDEALINALDVDGDQRISITEFVELSKSTGLSKVQMRERFRDKDFGNTGFLTMVQMKEVLNEMRCEGKGAKAKALPATIKERLEERKGAVS